MLTVREYAVKYGLPESTVYSRIYRGMVCAEYRDGWQIADAPPKRKQSKVESLDLDDIDDYALALIWLCGSIIEDGSIVIRNRDPFVPTYLSERLKASKWIRESGSYVCKISSVRLTDALRESGFTGRKDANLPPPPVDPAIFAAAFTECHSSNVRSLRHGRKGSRYYVPSLTFCASYAIMQHYISTLAAMHIIPLRTLTPAANGTSATIRITSQDQLHKLCAKLSTIGHHTQKWNKIAEHISQPYEYKGE